MLNRRGRERGKIDQGFPWEPGDEVRWHGKDPHGLMRIVADANLVAVSEHFSAIGEVALVPGRELTAAHLGDADLLLVRSVTPVDELLLSDSPVRFVGSGTSGFEHVDRDYLLARGIGFAYAPGANANSVVEYVLSVICSAQQRLERLLAGERVGIIGYGRIGRHLERRLQRLGIASCAYDPWLQRDQYPALTEWQQVLDCPVLSLHAELNDRQPWPSRHLLGFEDLQQLPSACLLINTGRGALLDQHALRRVLPLRPDLQLALDVWEFEPLVDAELLAHCRIATPHIAGYSYDGKLLATQMLYRAAAEFLELEVAKAAPLTDLQPLRIPVGLRAGDLIRWLQRQSYDVRVDDRSLRARNGREFDRLRAHYPRRRELNAFVVANAAQLDQESLALATAMGCLVPSR